MKDGVLPTQKLYDARPELANWIVHKFRQAEPLPIGFYGNGIAIKGFKFNPYTSKESLRILSDILDGYFPYILKNKYPNGVFIKVLDYIEKKYEDDDSSGVMNLQSAE